MSRVENVMKIYSASSFIAERTLHGCGNANCRIVRAAGMHTNGPCTCETDIYHAVEALVDLTGDREFLHG